MWFNISHLKFPSSICVKNVHDKDKAVHSKIWIHIKCNNLITGYRYLQNCDKFWCSIECCSTILPFNSLSSNKNLLSCCTTTDSNISQQKDLESNHNSSLSLKPPDLELFVSQFNDATPENSNDLEKSVEMHILEIHHNNKSISLFQINTYVVLIKIWMTFNISSVPLKFYLTNGNNWNKSQKKYPDQIIWILIIILMNLLQLWLVQEVPFLTFLIIYHLMS